MAQGCKRSVQHILWWLSIQETHIVEKGHSVTTVNGKHQGKKAKETGLEGCHAILEVQVQHVSCQVQQMWVR